MPIIFLATLIQCIFSKLVVLNMHNIYIYIYIIYIYILYIYVYMYIKKLYIKKQAETAFNVILNNHRKMGRC